MKRWVVSEEDYVDAVHKVWDHYKFAQVLLGAHLYEKMMGDLANLAFKVELPEWATHVARRETEEEIESGKSLPMSLVYIEEIGKESHDGQGSAADKAHETD